MTRPQTKMKFRNELKFFINYAQYYLIRQRLRYMAQTDPHVGDTGEYHIRSLYFDDIRNTALHEKLGGIRDRSKYRIRIYNLEDRVIHLEKKIKRLDTIAKVKEPLTRPAFDAIAAGDYEVLNVPEKPLLADMYAQTNQRLLRPKVIVDYVREPYVCENGNVRITFDKELRTGLHATDLFDKRLETVRAIPDGTMILEVKFDEYIPEYIRSAIQHEGLIRQSASKYVMCRQYLKENDWEDY
ncbi:polyphosphate polymerase domain-containing protein [Paenibacillus hodogayensis]|uniref:Polyphosphate polymerase domain-containing protein n=1 Tax=Paenibacillus hodogayensis TaxID=279208 RepID=A0ABV5W7M0_9BACL